MCIPVSVGGTYSPSGLTLDPSIPPSLLTQSQAIHNTLTPLLLLSSSPPSSRLLGGRVYATENSNDSSSCGFWQLPPPQRSPHPNLHWGGRREGIRVKERGKKSSRDSPREGTYTEDKRPIDRSDAASGGRRHVTIGESVRVKIDHKVTSRQRVLEEVMRVRWGGRR